MEFLPVIVYAWKALRHIDETLTDISFLCGFVYCLLGAFGATSMAGAFQALHGGIANASPSEIEAASVAWEAELYRDLVKALEPFVVPAAETP